jgi:hypothetical protein
MASTQNFKDAAGIDFYQFWGVIKAQKWSDHKLKSPYVETTHYAEVLNSYADGSNDLRLKAANQINNQLYQHNLDLTGTPFCYLIFALLPEDYSLAFVIFQIMQIFLFISSIVIMNPVRHVNRLGLVSLAFLLVLIYEPLLSDLRVGNMSSFQLFALVLITVFAYRVLADSSARNSLGPSVVFMCSLVFLTLLKPNLVFVTLLLAAHLWALHGTKVFARAAAAAAIFGAILTALPCIHFGSWMLWQDWYRYMNIGGGKLLYPISLGNYATVVLASQALGIRVLSAIVVVAAMLFILGLGALMMAISPDELGLKGMWRAVVRSLRDPHLSAAVGVTATLALAPLVWLHYYVISLLPALWLLTAPHHRSHVNVLGGLSIVLTSGVASALLNNLFGWAALSLLIIAIGWVPLWAGVLAAIACKKKFSPADSN